ncbi:MAG: hypothetical protein ACRD07_14770 [Acidimicrobiales bacterium]
MKTTLGTVAGAGAVALTSLVGLASPAAAKELESVTIHGPGLAQPVVLSTGDNGTVLDNAGRPVDLKEQLYADVVMGDTTVVDLTTERPTDELGPDYSVAWRLSGVTTAYEQELYPFAAGGPLVHIYLDEFGMWYRVQASVLSTLADLGVIAADSSGPKAPTSGAPAKKAAAAMPPAPTAAMTTGDPVWPAVAAGVGGGLAGVAGALVVHRARARRRREATIPL